MKIFFNPIVKHLSNSAKNTKETNNTSDKTFDTTSLANFPNYSYQINFGANSDNLESFYTAYSDGKGMPASYNMHLNTYTAEERAKITEVFANYRSFYDNMENCHTVEELKQAYPLEFNNLKASFSQEAKNNSFLNKFQDLADSIKELGEYVFPETQDNDLTVYLAKKIYLESKTKDEIDKDFYNDINKFYDIEDYKARFPFGKDGIIPQNIYKDLGLTTSRNETGFRRSLCCSREDYILKYGSVYKSKRKENFDEFIEDVLSVEKTEKPVRHPVKKGSANYEKYKYAMFLAWNNSLDLRKALSEYLFDHRQNNELLKPDFMEINSSKQKENVPMKEIMRGFWVRNPELRKAFATTCQKSFENIEHSIDKGEFEEFKKEIENERQKIYEVLAIEKAQKEEELRLRKIEQEKAQELISKKKAVRSAVIEKLHWLANYRPIPSNLFSATVDKVEENLPEVTHTMPYDFIKEIRDEYLLKINSQIGDACTDTFFNYFHITDRNDKITKFDEKIIRFFETGKKELTKMPKYESMAHNVSMLDYALKEELCEVSKMFLHSVVSDYFVYLIKNKAKDISYDKRKKIIENIYNKAITTDDYKEMCDIDTPVRTYMFRELTNLLCEIPADKLLSSYINNYNKRVIQGITSINI